MSKTEVNLLSRVFPEGLRMKNVCMEEKKFFPRVIFALAACLILCSCNSQSQNSANISVSIEKNPETPVDKKLLETCKNAYLQAYANGSNDSDVRSIVEELGE